MVRSTGKQSSVYYVNNGAFFSFIWPTFVMTRTIVCLYREV